ncbi:hypothetical protein QBC35DRAFT_448250 [Podospora australis]|uniref:Zn(2)-C6 fungal-type domain-containing protein n=1 Tax=Podospora australis TaxID=1536484 RepID=A0AAN7AMM1_9PEZI|nr:hypothetical protein QBC35DRAFT_448250 [Podospora australis]
MGIVSCLEPRFSAAIPDTPPEALTPDSLSHSSRQSEERSWNPSGPPSPPMSHYDPAVKANDMSSSSHRGSPETQGRREVVTDQNAPRQQLPSLSSIFGPPSQIRPFPSPLSDRPGTYPQTSSPLDRPPLLGSAGSSLERPYSSSSYFPTSTTPIAAQPRSVLDPRYSDRPQIPPLSRAFPGPLSPRTRDEPQRTDSRRELTSGGQWSVQQEASREYSLGSRGEQQQQQQQYRPAERYPTAHYSGASRDEGRASDYRDQLTPQSATSHGPPTPTAISVPSEAVPSKDGLGPKIWTGTHFLPRFVRAAEVPGEGLCYFYDDGSHCKTVIDGEAVNAHWGVTKAGKPRKRLAIACVTCREKKIKCDPDYPRCVQCEKFGRVCKFKNAPRGGHNASSPSTPSNEAEERRMGTAIRPLLDYARPSSHNVSSPSTPSIEAQERRMGGVIRPLSDYAPSIEAEDRRLGTSIRPLPDYTRPSSHSSGSVSPRTTLRHDSPEMPTSAPAKRARLGYEHYSPTASVASTRSPLTSTPEGPRPAIPWRQADSLPRIHEDMLYRAWQADQYVMALDL